ncbi:MAG: TolC family protein [Pseudomonadota bacterium]
MILLRFYQAIPVMLGILFITFAHASYAEPLSLIQALQLAEHHAPSMAAFNARIHAARHTAIPAGELPDPKLVIGIDNLPVNGADRFSLTRDFMTMQKVGIMQEMPNEDKRHARIDSAQAAIERAEAEQATELLHVHRETALAWIAVQTIERKLVIFESFFHENRLLASAIRAQIASGKGDISEAVVPKQEAAMLEERKDELNRDLAQARSKLRQWVGNQGDEPLAGSVPDWLIKRELVIHRIHHHPELAAFIPATKQAEAEVREAQSMKTPDWSWEVGYAKRGQLYSDMVMLQFTIDLPLFSSTRQNPKVAAKQDEVTRIEAEREAMLREHTQMLESDLAEYERLERSLQRSTQVFLKLAQEKVNLALASYRSGKGSLSSLIAARRELIEASIKPVELEGQRAMLAAKLHFSYGENQS